MSVIEEGLAGGLGIEFFTERTGVIGSEDDAGDLRGGFPEVGGGGILIDRIVMDEENLVGEGIGEMVEQDIEFCKGGAAAGAVGMKCENQRGFSGRAVQRGSGGPLLGWRRVAAGGEFVGPKGPDAGADAETPKRSDDQED